MANQVTAIKASNVSTDNQAPPALPALKTQLNRVAPVLGAEKSERILCCYMNSTNQIQIARSANISTWYFERVVFPQQRLLFEALPNALLEIHTSETATAILTDKIKCEFLQIHEAIATF